MTLNRREKILAMATGGMLVVVVLYLLLFTGGSKSTSQLRTECDQKQGEVDKKKARIAAGARASAQLADWESRALPSEPTQARTQYQNWLRTLADKSDFRRLAVGSNEGASRRNAYTLFTFTVRGRASLSALVKFLYGFYSAGHLQQIRRLDLKPSESARELDVNLTIEAMSLATADRKDRLTAQAGKGLRLAKLSDYLGPIVDRNFFAAYQPPRIEEPRPTFDSVRYTFVTGILDIDGRGEVWLMDRTAGKTVQLHQGDAFQVGGVRGDIESIGERDVVIALDGRRRRFASGDSLRAGIEAK